MFEEGNLKLYPIRHRWTVENVGWLVGGERMEGWPYIPTRIAVEEGKVIILHMWPRGREKCEEYVGIRAIGWKIRLYATVRVGENGSTERKFSKNAKGLYHLDKYLRRSSLLESDSLLEDGALTLWIEGVAWDEDREYNPKANLTSIGALIARTSVSSSRFAFRPPSPQDYLVTEWEVEVDEEQIKARSLDVELDKQTKLKVRVVPGDKNSDYLSRNGSLHLQLLQCRTDRVAMWWQKRVLDCEEWKAESKGCLGMLKRGEERKFYPSYLFIPGRHRLEIIRIEDATLVDENELSGSNWINYQLIFNHFRPAWFQQARRFQLSPVVPLPLPTDDVKMLPIESTATVEDLDQPSPPLSLPDYETVNSWASMFANGNLVQLRADPVGRLGNILVQAHRILDTYQVRRQTVNHAALIKAVQLTKLVINQAEELLTTKSWTSDPVRYITTEHLK